MSNQEIRVSLYGTTIAEAMRSWEEQGFGVSLHENGFVVSEKKVICDVTVRKFRVHIAAFHSGSGEEIKAEFNVLETENAAQKIVETVQEFLDKKLALAYPKGGDMA